MIRRIDINDFLKNSANELIVDVRSPGEFEQGHIPGAYNLNLFSNEERAIIGTLYKQEGRDKAILKGLDIVGPKMSVFVNELRPLLRNNRIYIHCWRGGMRSGFMAWLFDMFGYECYLLEGGYKSFRTLVLNSFDEELNLQVLGGFTGSGKTEILQKLKSKGFQVIDLEAMASHKGSAFGGIGLPPQPSNEHFENLLFTELRQLDKSKAIWVEDESISIGKIHLPKFFFDQKQKAHTLILNIPFEIRLDRLMLDYGVQPTEELEASINKVQKRMGPQHHKAALEDLHSGNRRGFIGRALEYYDKAYSQSLEKKGMARVEKLSFENWDEETITEAIMKQADRKK